MKKMKYIMFIIVLIISLSFQMEIKAVKDPDLPNLPIEDQNDNDETFEDQLQGGIEDLKKTHIVGEKRNECNAMTDEEEKAKCEEELAELEGKSEQEACEIYADEKCDECKRIVDNSDCIERANNLYAQCELDTPKTCDINDNEEENDKNVMELTSGCSLLDTEFGKILSDILKFIRIAGIVLCIVLGMFDFVKSVASGNEDNIKKNRSNFFKRLIAVVILLILPVLLDLVFNNISVTNEDMCEIE